MKLHPGRTRRVVAGLAASGLALTGAAVITLPAAADGPTTFTNTSTITVPGQDPLLDLQPASPSPSTIAVSGMAGPVIDIDVTLDGVSHNVFNDMDVLLVAPDGSNLVILSDIGGTSSLKIADDAELTFSDGAPVLDPTPVAVDSGTYAPTDVDSGETVPDDFTPGGGPAESTDTTFADAFNGLDPNGTWSLYVIDDTASDTGTIAGWSLTVTTATVDAGGPYAIDEGDPLSGLAATSDLPGATYAWDMDGDGDFDDANGSSPGFGAAVLALFGLGDGPTNATISVQATDGTITVTDSATLTVSNVAPTGTVANDSPIPIGQPVTLTLSNLDDPSAADLAAGLGYALDWDGDATADATGTWTTGDPEPTITVPAEAFTTVGDHPLTVTVTDKDGGTTDLDTTVQVNATTPTATLTNPGPVAEGGVATVTFSDQADTAPGATFAYSYDLDGDGTFDIVDSPDPTATLPADLTADGPATRTVTARISNQHGGSNDYTTDLVVDNVAPTGAVGNDGPVSVGHDATLTLTGLDDASTADVAAGLDWAADVTGDGVPDETGTWTTGDPDPTITVPASALATVGDHPQAVTVTDQDGGVLTLTTTVTVTAPVPTATLTNSGPVVEGGIATVTFTDQADTAPAATADATFTGQATAAPGATFTYSYDLDNDGTFDIVDSPDPTATLPADLTADGPASLTVTARISNQDGGFTDQTTDVEVSSEGPSVTVDAPATVGVSEVATVTVTLDDPSPVDRAAGFELTVDFGDGPTPGLQAASQALGATATEARTVEAGTTELRHTYATAGTYTLTLTAVDADGSATTVTHQVTVEPGAPTPQPSESDPDDPGPTGSASGGDGSGSLPDTGTPLVPLLVAALLAIGIGFGLYRRASRGSGRGVRGTG